MYPTTVISLVFDRVFCLEIAEMNDVNVAAEKNEEGTEARDFVDLGVVSADTKGGQGNFFDGIPGCFWG
jgi:hypothetical protein